MWIWAEFHLYGFRVNQARSTLRWLGFTILGCTLTWERKIEVDPSLRKTPGNQ
jgi:hypothetical protein